MTNAKSERFKIREMELEYQLQMQREKILAEAFLRPPGIYLVGLGGSAVIAYFGAAITPPEKRTEGQLEILAKGIIAGVSPYAGVVAAVADEIRHKFDSNESALGGLFQMAGLGGSGLFTALLILNEMKPDGATGGDGLLDKLLSAAVAA